MEQKEENKEIEKIGKMEEIQNSLKRIVKQILLEEEVEYVLGFEPGPLPLTAAPLFIESEDDIERLIWTDYCNLNLVKFLLEQPHTKKVGIILKNCEIHSLIVLINEKQIKREDVIIIGVPCDYGIIDLNKIKKIIGNSEIIKGSIEGTKIKILTHKEEQIINFDKILSDSCLFCKNKIPDEFDYQIEVSAKKQTPNSEELMKYQKIDEYQDVIEFEAKAAQERWNYFTSELEKCTLCMACRNACPLCYCKICFIDQNQPQWFDKNDDLSEKVLFHMTRALHLAGRCAGCDACSRACPEGVDIHLIYKKLRKSVRDRWNIEKVELGSKSVLGSYNNEDPQEFIMSEE
ncbi:MAG: hypothetical protein K9W44_11930 [Candidatus Lokiarchaeota archaeon]|nr:hypothetical protein [Candidatus Harpocratesius repetitus]